jgi:hypothetical protein
MHVEGPDDRTRRLVVDLKERLAEDAAAVMIFLGAGLSFGVGRRLGRGSFETPPPIADHSRFPSWLLLVDRMSRELQDRGADDRERWAYGEFAQHQDPIDVAQLYRDVVGNERFFEFLESQFATTQEDADFLTPSHEALVALPVRELFTTNYDGLIELAYGRWDGELTVSASPERFLAQEAARPKRHLIKLHGTWDEHASIVITRDDYARSRLDRVEMFRHLGQHARFATFLFVGFSLTDPNFNLIRDEARMVMEDAMPTSFLVQQHLDPVTRRYVESLGVEVVELFTWNELPEFLRSINPAAS